VIGPGAAVRHERNSHGLLREPPVADPDWSALLKPRRLARRMRCSILVRIGNIAGERL
jgi:hypothetical protein